MRPLITALVDTYNHEKYMEHAIVSVLEQGLSEAELEIVVVDDGSTDGASSIVQKFVPRVKNLRKRNGGQASALNAGFQEAQGEIVALLDGDDWWADGKLGAVLRAFEQNEGVSAVGHGYYEFLEGTGQERICKPEQQMVLNLISPSAAGDALRNWAFLQPSALAMRRNVLEGIMPISETLVFSADFPIAAACVAKGVVLIPQPLSYYRIHSANLYAGTTTDSAKELRKSKMDETMCEVAYPILRGLGVSPECVSTLLNPVWTRASRYNLTACGGSRLKTFRTEMRVFHSESKNPTIGYRLFKHLVVGGATLLLPPRRFYGLRDWYARHGLKRFREWLFKTGIGAGKEAR